VIFIGACAAAKDKHKLFSTRDKPRIYGRGEVVLGGGRMRRWKGGGGKKGEDLRAAFAGGING